MTKLLKKIKIGMSAKIISGKFRNLESEIAFIDRNKKCVFLKEVKTNFDIKSDENNKKTFSTKMIPINLSNISII